jgi:hypothetical protein
MKIKNEKGQVIVEALVALGAAVVIIGAIAIMVVTSLNNSELAKNQNLATQYAQQGMEVVRELSETDWATFSNPAMSGWSCLNNETNTLSKEDVNGINPPDNSNSCLMENGIFNRRVNIQHEEVSCSNNSKVLVLVGWNDSKCSTDSANLYCHNVTVESCFANIKVVPAL